MAQTTQVLLEQSTKTSTKTSITNEQSQKLIHTMLTMSFGCVAFLRNLFPDEYFVDQRFVPNKFEKNYDPKDPRNKANSIRVKTLVRGKSKEVDLFLNWIDKGALDAIRKGFLKLLSFQIFLDSNKPEDLQEVYTFTFDYNKDYVHFKVNDLDGGEFVSLLDSRKMLQQLMKRFIIITQSLDPLPQEKYMTMRMAYNDRVPKDYQPPFFIDGTWNPTHLKVPTDSNISKFTAGKVTTPHHIIQLKVLSRPLLTSEKENVVDIDPLEAASQFKVPNTIKASTPKKPSNKFVKIEPSQTTAKLREFLKSPTSEVRPTQVIKSITCECGSKEESEKDVLCTSCDGKIHVNCYALDHRKQSPTCMTCRSRSLGIEIHENLKLLMVCRNLYKVFTKVDIPVATCFIIKQLGFSQKDQKITAKAISFFFKNRILILEKSPRKLKKPIGNVTHQRGSSFIDVDIKGIVVDGESLKLGRYAWSLVPKISGTDIAHLKPLAARAKRFLFETTYEKGLAIDDCLTKFGLSSTPSTQDQYEESIINSSDRDDDESKKSEGVSSHFSALSLRSSSQGSDPISPTHSMITRKRACSYDPYHLDDFSSQPVVRNTRLKRRKQLSLSKKIISYD